MSQQLFAPTSSSSRRSASSKGSGTSDWSKVSGTSGGLGTKKAGLFLWDVKRPCCLGLIGSENLLVCGKPVGECGTAHQGGQFDPESPMEDLVFIRDPKLATRFLTTPFAQREWFSSGAMTGMAKVKKTVPEWAEVFRFGRSAAEVHPLGASQLDIDDQVVFLERAQAFATPTKATAMKAGELLDYEEDPPFSPFLAEEDLAQREKWREDADLPVGVLNLLEKLGDAMDKVMLEARQSQLTEFGHYTEIATDFLKVKAWQEHMESRVGVSVPIKDREFPSVWSALDYSVKTSESDLKDYVTAQKAALDRIEAVVGAMAKETTDWKLNVTQAFQDVDQILGRQIDELAKDQKALEDKMRSGGGGSDPRIQNGFLFPRQARFEGEAIEEERVRGEDDLDETLCDLRSRLRKLEGVIRSHPSGGGGGDGPPAFGNLGLLGVSDLAAWNLDQGSGFQFGLFVDGPALLTFKREDFISVSDQLAGLKRAGDIGLNQTQVRVLASFQNTLPEFFGKGTESDGSSLPALPKLSDWEAEDGINGAKFRLERALPLIQKQLSTYIDTYLGEDKLAARELAHRCLSHSMLFVTRLSDYITRTSRALRVAGYKVDRVWAILSRQVLRIFEDMARARACAVDLAPPVTKRSTELPEDGVFQDHNAALAMWAVLKTHDVMEDYLAHNFEDHPSIAAENVRFLTYNVMGAGGSNTDVEVKNLEKLVEKMDTANKNLRSQVDKLTSRIEKMEKK